LLTCVHIKQTKVGRWVALQCSDDQSIKYNEYSESSSLELLPARYGIGTNANCIVVQSFMQRWNW